MRRTDNDNHFTFVDITLYTWAITFYSNLLFYQISFDETMIAPFQVIDERYSVINNNSCNDNVKKIFSYF